MFAFWKDGLTYRNGRDTLKLIERRAIWQVHGKRCAYCRDPLSFAEAEIDHVLPESLAKNADEWHRIRSEQGLTDDFDIDGFENLLPSCRPCNSRKSGTPLALGRTAIELGVAGRAKPQVLALVRRFIEHDKVDKLRFALASALDSGKLSERDVSRLISQARNDSGVFRLSSIPWLIRDQAIDWTELARSAAQASGPARFSPTAWPRRRARALRRARRPRRPGRWARAWSGRSCTRRCGRRSPPCRPGSGPSGGTARCGPRRGLSDISLLPATLLFVTEDMTSDEAFAGQRARLDGKSIQDLVENGEATVKEVGSEMLAVQCDHGRTFMFEMMRADVNADGIEDMVIHWGGGPIRGTYRTASVVVLTRRSQDEMFSCISVEGLHSAR